MCGMRLAENSGPKKSPSGHHRTTLSSYIFATKARIVGIDNRKKLVTQQYVHQMSPQYGELMAESDWRVWGPHHISAGIASWQRYCTAVK